MMEKFSYDNKIVKAFAFATIAFGVIGMLVGLTVATQIFLPAANFDTSWLTFGRLRPLHTNAIIFAFVGNAMFMGVYYSLQRLLKSRMYSDTLSWINFWGWQLIILSAAISLPLGYTTSKEYAELEWPIDIAIALIWVVFGLNMIMTIVNRREKHIYAAIWFYIATFVTVAVLHIVNSMALPIGFTKSYSLYAGVQDALVQWWYGHNAVAFFLTTPFLGIMYYFLPKVANRPIYSYRLSIVHFWSLIFIYIWAGPHHLLYSALPDWAQNLGVAFSVMLIAPSWGGMVNGLLTLRGSWDKVASNPVLKFMVVALTGYGMATFEGPLLSLKEVNALGHFTDWIVGHVHIGGMAWNGFMIFAMLYWLVPRMWKTQLYSNKLANVHFWIGTLGILFYSIPLYWAGFTQGFMWKEFTQEGVLRYPNFLETVIQVIPFYKMRLIGGLLYFTGTLIMIFNLVKTMAAGSFVANEEAEAPALIKEEAHHEGGEFWHRVLERKPIRMTILALVAILIGSAIELVPTMLVKSNIPTIASVKPYTPLELEGRDLYIREGCVGCHSQLIRPFRNETMRYGEYTKAGENVYDHPFLWGSRRTGPDLAREGHSVNRRPNVWQFDHMLDPDAVSTGSIMPRYPWLFENDLDNSKIADKINAMRTLGVPYPEGYENQALDDLNKQAEEINNDLKQNNRNIDSNKEIIALIAYLQRLGRDIESEK